MARVSVVKGVCTSVKCVRRAKTMYECEKCDSVMKACSYHRQRVLDEMKSHLIDNHPRAVESVGRAYDKAVENAPIEAARQEKIANSPALQRIEQGKRWLGVLVIAAGVGAVLWLLTWLKLHH